VILLFENEIDQLFLANTFAEMIHSKQVIWVRNKIDLAGAFNSAETSTPISTIHISAKNNIGIEDLKTAIVATSKIKKQSDTMLTNLRHYENLVKAHDALGEVLNGLSLGITGDFLAQDIRLSLYHLGEITGQITTDDLLANIFSKFCIGK